MQIKLFFLVFILSIVYIVCVTRAAMYFSNPKILCWYLMLVLYLPFTERSIK